MFINLEDDGFSERERETWEMVTLSWHTAPCFPRGKSGLLEQHSCLVAAESDWALDPFSQNLWMLLFEPGKLLGGVSYSFNSVQFSSVQLLSCVQMDCSMTGLPVHHQLLELAQTHVHWVSDAILPFYPLSSLSPPAFNLTQLQGLCQRVSSPHQVSKVLEFQLQHQTFQEYSGLISLKIDWLDLLAGQETLRSLLQHHSSKTSVLRCSAFFMVQLSHPYRTTGKNIALTVWTFVDKATSLCFLICCVGLSRLFF